MMSEWPTRAQNSHRAIAQAVFTPFQYRAIRVWFLFVDRLLAIGSASIMLNQSHSVAELKDSKVADFAI